MDGPNVPALATLSLATDDEIDRLVIGLDFGTTYSGIAYAFTTKPDQVYSITEWPGSPGRTVPKTPTVLKYSSKNSFKWGYELDRTIEDKIEGIKLLLDPKQERPLYDPTSAAATKAEIEKLGKPPIDVATDYIGAIYQHALKKIEGKVPKSYLEMLDKQFVLSVPAVWSEKAKDTTLRAARHANITPIELIKESEAAALFTLHDLKHQGLAEGDAITICDAGGGTVDLVSYEISKLNPLELKELVPSTGGIAGSRIINKRFEQWIKDTIGERAYLDLKESNGYRLAVKQFDETIKPSFKSENDEDQYVSFPMAKIKDNASKGIKANTLTLTGRDLKGIFDPVFKDIDRLVDEQVSKVRIKRMQDQHPKGALIKAIFLVGGFGSSIYLRDAIAKAHPDTQVIQPNDAWSAIVRGAVLSKLPKEASVVSSIAEKHYGVAGGAKWDSIRDKGLEDKRYWDQYEEVHRCQVMNWYIHKHDDLERSRKIEISFFDTMPYDSMSEDYKKSYTLRMCPMDKAPVHLDSTVTECCKLRIDLSVVDKSKFKTKARSSDGMKFLRIDYHLVVKVEGARMAFSFECGGKEYGAVSAEY